MYLLSIAKQFPIMLWKTFMHSAKSGSLKQRDEYEGDRCVATDRGLEL